MKRLLGLFVAGVFALCFSTAGAAIVPNDTAIVAVNTGAGYTLLIDMTSVKYFQGLSGREYVEAWFEYRYTDKPATPESILEWFGVDTKASVQRIRQHYLFFFPAPAEEPRALRMELNVELYDAGGVRIFRTLDESAPGSKWHSLDRIEQKVMSALLDDPLLQDGKRIDSRILTALPYMRANEGFLGLRWGIKPAEVKKISYLSSPDAQFDIYQAAGYDVRPILGVVKYSEVLQLVFDRADGLVQGRITVSPEEVDTVERYLFDKLGHPVILEMSPQLFEKTGPFWLWNLGKDAKVVFYTGDLQHRPRVEISKPGFAGIR